MRLGILISGGGTTFLNLHQKILDNSLDAEIACVISSSFKAKGVTRAKELGYPTQVIRRKPFDSDEAFSTAIVEELSRYQCDLIILAGFLKRFLPLTPFENHCLNIHPSLIPAFCGKGFYGMKVHQAVWEKGCRISGCTVHLVNAHYDEGPIIVQKATSILSSDTPEIIQKKVFQLECEALPEAINLFINRQVRLANGRCEISLQQA